MRREIIERVVVGLVRGADPERLEPGKNVELRHEELGQAVEARSVARENGVEPTTATLATGDRAELFPANAHPLAIGTDVLGREGAGPDPRDVRLDDPDHAIYGLGADPRGCERVPGNRVRGRHE